MKEIKIESNNKNKNISNFCFELFKNKTISFIKKNINKGNIKVNNKKVKDNYILNEYDIVSFFISFPKLNDEFKKCKIKTKIFYEDKNIIVFDKQKGIYCQEDKNEKINTLSNYLKLHLYNKSEWDGINSETEPSLINRIDVNTEGLVIAGKNKNITRLLNDEISNKRILKKYIALVHGKLKKTENYWVDYIYKHPTTKNKMKVCSSPNSYKTSIIETNVFLIKEYFNYSLVEIELISGKKHQIRAHLSFYNHPLVGDYKYANKKYDSKIKSQVLISNEIKFNFNKSHKLFYLNKIKLKKTDPKKIEIEKILNSNK